MENRFYRLTVDKATGRITVFDKALNRDVCKDMEIVAEEERGGNYVAVGPLTGRTIPSSVTRVEIEENSPVRAIVKISGQIADIPITQRVILYANLKRLDLENRVEWKGGRFLGLQQLFPIEPTAQVTYGVPFGAQPSTNFIPNSGPHLPDEIPLAQWKRARQIQDWIFAGSAQWGLTITSDHHLVKLGEGLLRAEMLRGARFTSVKVVRGEQVGSLLYPPPGTYSFNYSLSSAAGDWKSAKSYQAGMNWNSPLVAVSVVDELSRKTLPPTYSFCKLPADNLVISAVKRSDLDSALLLRVFEIQGSSAETEIDFLGKRRSFREVTLLEEDAGTQQHQLLKLRPYEIKTIKLQIEQPSTGR